VALPSAVNRDLPNPRLAAVVRLSCPTKESRITLPTGKDALPAELLQTRLSELPEWELKDGKLHREIRFPDFVEAFGFMAKVAMTAESLGHHPEWSNTYNKVWIDLSTHEANGVTELDLDFARRVDRLLS
jgi:4a-hydroxytetrahydrobiopterin dehydratase